LSVFGGPGGAGSRNTPFMLAEAGKIPGGGGGGGGSVTSVTTANPIRLGGAGGGGLVRITTY
jgi:hypothetical protein